MLLVNRPAISGIASTSASMTIAPSTSLTKPTGKKQNQGFSKTLLQFVGHFLFAFWDGEKGRSLLITQMSEKLVAVSIAPCNPFDLVSSSATKKFNKHVHFLKVPSKWYPIKYAVGGIFITV